MVSLGFNCNRRIVIPTIFIFVNCFNF